MLEHGYTLKEHFGAIVGMLREKTVESYDIVMRSETAHFEDYLKKERIKYSKTVSYGKGIGEPPINTFRLEE
jgi:tRNA isopentenyl-2-thiomethyl-A-37 hydroxylase MiaE